MFVRAVGIFTFNMEVSPFQAVTKKRWAVTIMAVSIKFM